MNYTNPEVELPVTIYSRSSSFLIKTAVLGFVSFSFGFWPHLPLGKIFTSKIQTIMAANPSCPMDFDRLDFSFFWTPTLTLNDVTISSRCLGQGQDIKFDQISIKLKRPSFYPVGVKLDTTVYQNKKNIKLESIIGLGKNVINLPKQKFDYSFLSSFSSDIPPFQGSISIQANFIGSGKKMEGNLKIESHDFILSSYSISGMTIPEMALNELELNATYAKEQLNILTLTIGNSSSPFVAQSEGIINLASKNLAAASGKMMLKLKFSKELLDQLPIGMLFVNKTKNSEGMYEFLLEGPIKNWGMQFLK